MNLPDPTVPTDLLHELRNLVGLVHISAVDALEASQNGEDVRPLLVALLDQADLALDVLRGLSPAGREVQPFDLRAAVLCARVVEPSLSLGMLGRRDRVDVPAGVVIDLIVELAARLGAPSAIHVNQDDVEAGLLFSTRGATEEDVVAIVEALGPAARVNGLLLEARRTAIRLA